MSTYPSARREGDSAYNERTRFAERLHQALKGSGRTSGSAIVLTREFNHKHPQSAVTYHAVRKWLCGDSIPTQEKMRALAEMLNVHISWLRYGENFMLKNYTASDLSLLTDMERLDDHHKALLREFVQLLLSEVEQQRPGSSAEVPTL